MPILVPPSFGRPILASARPTLPSCFSGPNRTTGTLHLVRRRDHARRPAAGRMLVWCADDTSRRKQKAGVFQRHVGFTLARASKSDSDVAPTTSDSLRDGHTAVV